MEIARTTTSSSPLAVPRRCLLCRADFACSAEEAALACGRSDMERLSAVVDATVVLTGGPQWWGSKLLCHDCDLALDEISRALKNRLAIRRCFMKNVAALHDCDVFVPATLGEPAGVRPAFDNRCSGGGGWEDGGGGGWEDGGGGREDVGDRSERPLASVGAATAAAATTELETRACRSLPSDRDGGGRRSTEEQQRQRGRCSPRPAKQPSPVGEATGGDSRLSGAAAASRSPCNAVQQQGHIIMPRDSQGHLENLKDAESSSTNYSETPGGCNSGPADRCQAHKRKSAACTDDGVLVEASAQPGPRKLSRLLQTLSSSAATDGCTSSPPAPVGATAVALLQLPPMERGNRLSAAADARAASSASSALRRLSVVLGAGLPSAVQATRNDRRSTSSSPLEAVVAGMPEVAAAVRGSCPGWTAPSPAATPAPAGESRPKATAEVLIGSEFSAAARKAADSGGSCKPPASPSPESVAAVPVATGSHELEPESPVTSDRVSNASDGIGPTLDAVASQQPILCAGSEISDDTDSRPASVSTLQLCQAAPDADTSALMPCRTQKQLHVSRLHSIVTDCTSEHPLASFHATGQASSGPVLQHVALSSFLASLALPRPQLHQQPQSAGPSSPMAAAAAPRKTHGLHASAPPPAACSKLGPGHQTPPTSVCANATGLQQHQRQHLSTANVARQLPTGGRPQHHSPVPPATSAAVTVSAVLPGHSSSLFSACLSQTALPDQVHSRSSATDTTASGSSPNWGKSTINTLAPVPPLRQYQLPTSSSAKIVVPAAGLSRGPPPSSSAAVAVVDTPAASCPSNQAQVALRHVAAAASTASTEQQSRSKSPAVCTQAATATACVESPAATAAQAYADLPGRGRVKHGPLKLAERGSAMSTLWKLLQQPAQPGQDQSGHGSASSAINAPVHNGASSQPIHDPDATACTTPAGDNMLLGSSSRTALPAASVGSMRDAAAAPLSYLVRSAAARALVEAPLSAMRSTAGNCRRSPGTGCGGSSGGSSLAAGATMPLLAGMFEKLCEPPPPQPPPRSSMHPAATIAAVPAARRPIQMPAPAQPQRLGAVSPTNRPPQEALPHPHRRLRRYSVGHRYQRSPSNGGLGHASFSNDPCRRRLIRTAAVQRLSPNVFGSSANGKAESMEDEADACADEHESESFALRDLEHTSYGRQSRAFLSADDASAACSTAVDLSNEAFFSPSHLELKSEPVDV